jgi:hypothetical protein
MEVTTSNGPGLWSLPTHGRTVVFAHRSQPGHLARLLLHACELEINESANYVRIDCDF